MGSSDPYGRAIRDYYRGEQEEPLVDGTAAILVNTRSKHSILRG
jgi:hypothetical protein